ncbi:MAG: hypothetical protein IKL79_03325 [Clostridia bacterium]|nr:hypothetical protein [Clostridia bacterium]
MKEAKSLEEFLKQRRGLKSSASAKSLSEYMSAKGINPISDYSAAVRSAINAQLSDSANYGTQAELLARSGLSGGGYAEYLEEAARAKQLASVSAAGERMENQYITAQAGYEDYLQKYRSTRDSKMKSLESQLVGFGIMRLDETYAIGIDKGLSPEDAATVSANVYRALRDSVFDKCIIAAQSSYMDEAAIRSYAARMGLLEEDINELVWQTGRFLDKGKSAGYTDELKGIANTK